MGLVSCGAIHCARRRPDSSGDTIKPEIANLSVACLLPLSGCGPSPPTPPSASNAAPGAAMPGTHDTRMPQAPATVADGARGAMLIDGFGKLQAAEVFGTASPRKHDALRQLGAVPCDCTTKAMTVHNRPMGCRATPTFDGKQLRCLILYWSNGQVTRVAKVELSPLGQPRSYAGYRTPAQ